MTIFHCPAITIDKYAAGAGFMPNGYVAWSPDRAWTFKSRLASVSNPAMLFLQVCGEIGPYSTWFTTAFYFASSTTYTLKHSNRANMSFVDGHVGDVTVNDISAAYYDSNHKGGAFHMADDKAMATIKSSGDSGW